MSINNDIVRRELICLFKKHSNFSKNGDSTEVDNCLRKLTGYTPQEIPNITSIEDEIIKNVKCSSRNDETLIEIQNYIRKIKNMSIRDPGRLLFFLKELSPLCKPTHSNAIHMKPFLSVTRSMDNIRTSTPLSTTHRAVHRRPVSELGSLLNLNQPMKTVPLMENNISKSNSFQISANTNNTNNSPMTSSRPLKSSHNYQISNELTEFTIVGDLLYVILGCNGEYFKWNTSLMRLEVLNNAIISPHMNCMISKLTQIGVAYSEIRSYVDSCCRVQSSGVVCQGLCSALNEHLASYTNLVSVLHSQYNAWSAELEKTGFQEECSNRLTLQRLILWLHDPAETIFFIMTVVYNVKKKRGGELSSSLFNYLLNGSSKNNKLLRHLLLSAVEPLFQFIEQWIYDGVLEECHQEFFVAVNSHYELNSSWTKKYALRSSMIPSFITTIEAEKILLAGKSINFLREVCEEKVVFKNRREFLKIKNVTAESMINQDVDRSFENMIYTVYEETSKNLLKIMFEKYHLMDHLKALRKFLLQGQGDFILKLIEILGPELSKPGCDLYANNMIGSLDEALRNTNAQYESNDILKRVEIKLMSISDNETGWDAFTLNYRITDERPLLTIVNKDSFTCYLRTFMSLFRSRRVHFILNSFFKRQNSSHRSFYALPEVSRVIHSSQISVLEMLHFVNQIQYYINFEVLEASWKKFTESIDKAKDLDSVMKYHEIFLKEVTQRCFLEPECRDILSNLRTIYDLIISFELLLDDMFSCFQDELRFRASYQDNVRQLSSVGKWGVDDAREKKEKVRLITFYESDVLSFHHKLRSHHNQYETQVVKFLYTLADHSDARLRCLYANLDFNYRYKDLIRNYRNSLMNK